MSEPLWTLADIPDLSGRQVLVTGTTLRSIGQHVALELARHGATVVTAGRNPQRLAETRRAILDQVPRAELGELVVDLADLASVRRAAERAKELGPIHTLVNNAGVMAVPYRRTADGFEMQMATNHFGPFLLTGLLLDQLVASGDGRVVSTSSIMHRRARSAPVGDPRVQQGRYLRWPEYSQSKLANLLFVFELDRRLRSAKLPVKALAAHPGVAATNLMINGQGQGLPRRVGTILDAAMGLVSQSPARGALPVLMAATADLPGSTYVGPDGPAEWRGNPHVVGCTPLARDVFAQRRLWEVSEEAVGLSYP